MLLKMQYLYDENNKLNDGTTHRIRPAEFYKIGDSDYYYMLYYDYNYGCISKTILYNNNNSFINMPIDNIEKLDMYLEIQKLTPVDISNIFNRNQEIKVGNNRKLNDFIDTIIMGIHINNKENAKKEEKTKYYYTFDFDYEEEYMYFIAKLRQLNPNVEIIGHCVKPRNSSNGRNFTFVISEPIEKLESYDLENYFSRDIIKNISESDYKDKLSCRFGENLDLDSPYKISGAWLEGYVGHLKRINPQVDISCSQGMYEFGKYWPKIVSSVPLRNLNISISSQFVFDKDGYIVSNPEDLIEYTFDKENNTLNKKAVNLCDKVMPLKQQLDYYMKKFRKRKDEKRRENVNYNGLKSIQDTDDRPIKIFHFNDDDQPEKRRSM